MNERDAYYHNARKLRDSAAVHRQRYMTLKRDTGVSPVVLKQDSPALKTALQITKARLEMLRTEHTDAWNFLDLPREITKPGEVCIEATTLIGLIAQYEATAAESDSRGAAWFEVEWDAIMLRAFKAGVTKHARDELIREIDDQIKSLSHWSAVESGSESGNTERARWNQVHTVLSRAVATLRHLYGFEHEILEACEGGLGVMTADPVSTIRSHGIRMRQRIEELEAPIAVPGPKTYAVRSAAVEEAMRLIPRDASFAEAS